LIEVLAQVRDALAPTTRLCAHIIGDGPERDTVARMVKRHGLASEVTMRGALTHEEMRLEYARSDVFVLSSVEESFGLAALEARASGLPVVVRAEGGPSRFIADGREGLVAESDAGMAEALIRLARDSDLRAAIAEHNRTTPTGLRWNDVLDKHLEVYESAMERAC
jgi:glycosyltransferase involved in cell wall biosynthesis